MTLPAPATTAGARPAGSPAVRLLWAARRLVLDHGARKVTVAEIAQVAGVGKGTVYLYWSSKEDLILALFAEEVEDFLREVVRVIRDDPQRVRLSRLMPLVLSTALDRPLTRHLFTGDPYLLRVVADRETTVRVLASGQPATLSTAVLPILREAGLARDDHPLQSQAYAMRALVTGFMVTMTPPAGVADTLDPGAALSYATAALLEPSTAPHPDQLRIAAQRTIALIEEACRDLRRAQSRPEPAGSSPDDERRRSAGNVPPAVMPRQ